MEVVLTILKVLPDGKTVTVAWFDSQLALDRWFLRWSKGGDGTIVARDLSGATKAVTHENGRVIRMQLTESLEVSARAFVGVVCHAHLELEGANVATDRVLITYLIA